MATVTPLRQPEMQAELHGSVKKSAKGFRYAQALPHELKALSPLIIDFFKEVKYQKAIDNPWPIINSIYADMQRDPYSIVYVCVDEDLRAQGYMWFRVQRNEWQEPYIVLEHIYVIAEHRHTFREARITREFINYVIHIGERCGAQYINTMVKTKRLEASRAKLGFKAVELKMTFMGDAEAFRNANPSFARYKVYNEDKEELINEEENESHSGGGV